MAISDKFDLKFPRYDMRLGNSKVVGNHDDIATCVEYSEETCKILAVCNSTNHLQKKRAFSGDAAFIFNVLTLSMYMACYIAFD